MEKYLNLLGIFKFFRKDERCLELPEIVSFDQKMFQKIVPPIHVHQQLSAGVNVGPSIGYSVYRHRSEAPISTSRNLGL